MKTTTLRYLAASCAFGLIPAVSQAQVGQQLTDQSAAKQAQTEQSNPPGQLAPGQTRPAQPQQGQDQAGRPQPGQTLPGPTTPGQRVNSELQADSQQGANRVSQQGEKSIEKLITKKLMIENKAEVEIAQIGIDKASSDEVRQFAQTLVKEHRQLGDELTRFHGSQGSEKAGATGQPNQNQRSATPPGASQPGANQPGSAQPGGTASQATTLPPGASQPGGAQAGRSQGDGDASNRMANRGGDQNVVAKVADIAEKACQNHLQMVREELQGREGHEFDMAFVGLQIASHTRAVAEMKALQGVGSPELQQVVQKAEKHMTSHLDQAKQLADSLKDRKSN